MKRVKIVKPKDKSTPIQTWTGPEDSRWLRLPGFLEHRYMEVPKLSAALTLQEIFLALTFVTG
jgi:hypothetical protein